MTNTRAIAFLAMLLLASGAVTTRADNERGLWDVWKLQRAATSNNTPEVIAACEAFEQADPADPLAIVARQFRAWLLLKQGHNEQAAALLTPMIKSHAKGIDAAASQMACAWLTRLDRETLKPALQKIYLRDVAYPETLEVWGDSQDAPPRVDRWGTPWDYALIGFRHLPGMLDQKYRLRSVNLGSDSDLAEALTRPYADRITLKPIRLKRTTSGAELVEFQIGESAETALLAPGTRYGRILFPYMGTYIILVADRDHWKVLPKPR